MNPPIAGFHPTVTPLGVDVVDERLRPELPVVSIRSNDDPSRPPCLVLMFIEKSTPIRSKNDSDREITRISTATDVSWSRRSASSRSCTSRITSAVWLTTRAPPMS